MKRNSQFTTDHSPQRALPLLRWAIALALLPLLHASFGCAGFSNGAATQGVSYYNQGQYQMALTHFQQAVAAEPQNSDAYYNLAATYHRMGSQQRDRNLLSQAEQLYNQALDLDENNTDCYRGLAVLLAETERSDRAFNLLKNWSQRNPRSSDAHVELARLYEEFGDSEVAKNELQQALALDQYNARAWAALGFLREKAGDPMQALANYQRSYQLNRSQPGIADRIATLQRQTAGNPWGTVAAMPGVGQPGVVQPGAPPSGAAPSLFPNWNTNPAGVPPQRRY